MRRHRKVRAAWDWAVDGTATMIDNSASGGGQPVTVGGWLLPPGRVKWLCDTSEVDHITFDAALLWLSFSVEATYLDTLTASALAQKTDLYVMKVTQDETGGSGQEVFTPFSSPATPSAVTAWDTPAQSQDGLDPFLWCHRWWGYEPGSQVSIYSPDSQVIEGASNATDVYRNVGTHQGYTVSPGMLISAAFQPTVEIRSKRRLAKHEGLWIGMSLPSLGLANGIQYNLQYAARLLVSRSR